VSRRRRLWIYRGECLDRLAPEILAHLAKHEIDYARPVPAAGAAARWNICSERPVRSFSGGSLKSILPSATPTLPSATRAGA
jgi:hypothetical protein